jgi:hypothetical protein
MKRLMVICCMAMLLVTPPAIAMTGKQLKDNADYGEKDPRSYSQGYFLGYVAGVADETTTKSCPPGGVAYGQIAEVVRKYLKDHPEELHLDPNVLVLKAIQTAWPCK